MISKKTLITQAADNIREDVLEGRLLPGQRVTESDLSSAQGVSMGTIRVALDRLEREGLIYCTPYSGWYVASLSRHDAWEIYTLRSSVESLAARLAAESADPLDRSQIAGAMERLSHKAKSGDMDAAVAADFDLHKTIIKACGHARLSEHYRIIEQQVRLYMSHSERLLRLSMPLSDQSRPDPLDLVGQHQPIVEAILARDGPRAEELARQHNLEEGLKFVSAISEVEEQKEKPSKPRARAGARRAASK